MTPTARLLLVLLPLCGHFHSPALAEDSPPPTAKTESPQPAAKPLADYIRFAQDEKGTRLEVAVRSFLLPDGTTIDLAGAVHIADASYYKDLNSRFTSYDAVLYELVGSPSALKKAKEEQESDEAPDKPNSRPHPLRFLQQTMGSMLKLSFQLDEVDYSPDNMVHADVTPEEFAALQKARGESMMTLMAKAMAAQYDEEFAEDNAAAAQLDGAKLLRILLSRNAAAEFKILLARIFDQAERTTAKLEGPGGSAILKDRNDVAFRKLKEVAAAKQGKRLCVFYGAAHMPGLESMILAELNGKETATAWLPAWNMPKIAATTPSSKHSESRPK
ncbi:MAG: hypothetical protein DVB22_000984 [Verrucomicrobia bacterium]|jgi:hypothetical protein|nr:MAG: hypothetical protein DVB22_000984 [Verrucomicrobiota bacterium]